MELLEGERRRTGAIPSLRVMMVLDALKQRRRMTLADLSETLHMSTRGGVLDNEQSNRNLATGVRDALRAEVSARLDAVLAEGSRSCCWVTPRKSTC